MRFILLSFVLFIAHTPILIAQNNIIEEDKNYKHSNTIHQHHSTTFESDTVTLRDQKTHKRSSRNYVVAPSDSLPNRNVQGEKAKANYKNQFN